jgi:hypothetical protein
LTPNLTPIRSHSLLPTAAHSGIAALTAPSSGPYHRIRYAVPIPTILIELTVPAELDISTCDLGEYRAWTEWDVVDAANAHFAAGQVDEVYFVDVDRRTLVIDATYRLGSSPADVAELEQILASIDVVR